MHHEHYTIAGSEPVHFWHDTDGKLDGQPSIPLTEDAEIVVEPVTSGVAWILSCESFVYDLIYKWINGTVREIDLRPSNGTTARIFAAPISHDLVSLADSILANAAILTSPRENSKDLAKTWSTIFSQIAIALSPRAMSPRQNLPERSRTSLLVARVPQVPLSTLVGLNLTYAVVGIILAFVAMSSKPRYTREVQARLSLPGLPAAFFESSESDDVPVKMIEDLFEERDGGKRRVGIMQTKQGGWRYASSVEI